MNNRKTIGICITNLHQNFINTNLKALCADAKKRGFDVRIFASYSDLYRKNGAEDQEGKIFRFTLTHDLNALILFSDVIKDDIVKKNLIQMALDSGIPVLSIKEKFDGCCNLLYDAESALRDIIEHLIKVHHCTRINFISGIKEHPVSVRRDSVYKETLERNGIPVEEARHAYGDFWSEPTKRAVEGFLASPLPMPEAIVCANDSMAIAVCDSLKANGIRVPDDIIVTGIGGLKDRDFHFPRLTTAIYDPLSTANCVLDALEAIFDGDEPPASNQLIPCSNVYSESCGCKHHSLGFFEQRLVETYSALEIERGFQHEMNDFVTYANQANSLYTISKLIAQYNLNPGIRSYNLYLKADLVRMTKENIENDNPAATYVRLCSNTDGVNTTELIAFTPPELPHADDQLAGEDSLELLYIPLNSQDTYFGYMAIKYDENLTRHELLFNLITAVNISLDTLFRRAALDQVSQQLSLVSEQTIQSLAEIVEAKSEVTGLHVKRVSEYTRILAKNLGYSVEDIDTIRIASMMHDIGKINISPEILEKPGKLTPEEFEIIKTHVTEGERMLIHSPGKIMETACVIAKQHHEKWDGNGYLRMKGEEINREARIVALADVFDALVSARPYKPAFPLETAYKIIVEDRGSHFDPEVVDAFVAHFDEFTEVYNSYKD